jgi:hypothetical protein
MVDELIVFCSNRKSGCLWEGERHSLIQHVHTCSFQPKFCKWKCGWSGLDIDLHEEKCLEALQLCTKCEEPILKLDLERHKKDCDPEMRKCILCGAEIVAKRFDDHDQVCPQSSVSCNLSRYGCQWVGKRIELGNHCKQCPFIPLEPFFVKYHTQQDLLAEENRLLKRRISEIEKYYLDLNAKLMESMSRGNFDEGIVPAVPPIFLDSVVYDFRMLRTDMEQLGISIVQGDLKRDVEQSRVRDDIKSLRTLCHTLQMQILNLTSKTPTASTTSRTPTKKGKL